MTTFTAQETLDCARAQLAQAKKVLETAPMLSSAWVEATLLAGVWSEAVKYWEREVSEVSTAE